jgi:hypothetical protein
VGDIAWGARQHEGREQEWKIRFWVENGHVVAWSWLKEEGRGQLGHDVHPEHLLKGANIRVRLMRQLGGTRG